LLKDFSLPVVKFSENTENLRKDVRRFIEEELKNESFISKCDSWLSGFSAEFSRKLGERGWIGITLPQEYGGRNGSTLERYVITEELLAAGAPVAAHWVADRQTAPLLMKFGTKEQRQKFLPKICKGECFFSIGLSEPNAGSDLAAISTRAEKVEDKWILNGSKIWTTGAHNNDYMIVLCRTSPKTENRHEGISQLILDLRAPGVTIRPIPLMTGEHEFNEVFFEDVEIPENMVVGELGNGWKQSMTELAYERSGSERLLSTFPLLNELVMTLRKGANERSEIEIGRLVSRLWVLRRMSIGVAAMLEKGTTPNIAAALVKDLGTKFESEIAETARLLVDSDPSLTSSSLFERILAQAILHSPGFTLRGGTTEILRSIISKGLGV
jgi:hypothetical protein